MKVAILGYGKMGKAIEAVIHAQGKQDSVELKIGSTNIADLTVHNLQKSDVAIDFSRPELAYTHIQLCFEAGIPVVCGTTGWLDRLPEIKDQCEKSGKTLFYAPNFSIGVNIFFEVSNRLAALMNRQPNYDVTIEEIHHTEKLDAPSGTAIKLAELTVSQIDRKKAWSTSGERSSDEIRITSKRMPQVPGIHNIQYLSDVDKIELKHTAFSRKGFAEGAVLAARWIIGKSGYFEMKDLLEL